MYQTNMQYTFNLHNGACQLYLSKKGHPYKAGDNNKTVTLRLGGGGWEKQGQTTVAETRGWWQRWGKRLDSGCILDNGFHLWKQNLGTFPNGNGGLLSEVGVMGGGGQKAGTFHPFHHLWFHTTFYFGPLGSPSVAFSGWGTVSPISFPSLRPRLCCEGA